MFIWMFDVSPLIAALTGPRPKVVWSGQYGNTLLALVDASDRMPVMRHYRWLLCAGYQRDLREVIGDFGSWPVACEAANQWHSYLAGGGTVARWKEHQQAQRQSEIY
jgi:hypothetical protein